MKTKSLIAAMSAIILTSGFIAGCGGGTTDPGNTADQAESNEPYPISLVIQQQGDIPSPDNEVQKAIEQYTNTKLSIQWIPGSNFEKN